MNRMSDNELLEELNKRFLDNQKALHDMRVMNEKIEKLNIKLAESEKLKTNFLSNIRNEINNPLTSILGMSRELTAPMKDEKLKQLMAQMIYKEAFELDFQLRNIFMAAELEAGEATVNFSRIDVGALVGKAVSALSGKAEEKNLTVEVFCRGSNEQEQKLFFLSDEEKLQLVVMNLLANAIEFNTDGKTVRIEAGKKQNMLHLSFADQGIGVPEQGRERLFERFHQLDRGSCKRHKGHGLGLSISKALVEMLQGRISAASAPGGGSLFTVTLPESAEALTDAFSGENELLFEGGSTF